MRDRWKDRITIKTDASTVDDPDPSFTGTLVANLAANLIAVSGGETVRGKLVDATTQWVVEIRRRSDVTTRHRISVVGGFYNGATLNIVKVLHSVDSFRRPVTLLHCVEADA